MQNRQMYKSYLNAACVKDLTLEKESKEGYKVIYHWIKPKRVHRNSHLKDMMYITQSKKHKTAKLASACKAPSE